MITLEEAIEFIVVTYGNQIIPLEAFSLDLLTIQSLFKNTIREYQEYFPNVKNKTIYGSSLDTSIMIHLPDCVGSPMSLRFGGYPNVVGLNSKYDKPNWQWDYQSKTIRTVLGGGPWIVTYASDYTLTNLEMTEYIRTIRDEDEIELVKHF